MSSDNGKSDFEALLGGIMNAAYGMALHLARNTDDAEDLLQEASVRAFTAFSTYQAGTNFKAWFFRILINHFLNDLKRRDSRPQQIQVEAEDDGMYDNATGSSWFRRKQDPAHMLLDGLDAGEIKAAFAALPEDFRVVALLYFFDEFSYQQIAEVVGRPVGTVRSRLHRARKILQTQLRSLAAEKGIVPATE